MTITYFKIDNFDTTSNLFTWTINPYTFDDSFSNNYDTIPITYQRHHVLAGLGGIAPKDIVLTGFFYGTNKLTDYASMALHFSQSSQLKKLYFQSDRFYLGVGLNCKMTQTGGRTNFTDYVATFHTILGTLLGDTEKTSGTNGGNVPTYVTYLTGQATALGGVVLTDGFGTTFTFPSMAANTYYRYSMVKLVQVSPGSNVYWTEWGYGETSPDNLTWTQVPIGVVPSILLLQIDVGANVSTITATNTTGLVVKFRDGWVV